MFIYLLFALLHAALVLPEDRLQDVRPENVTVQRNVASDDWDLRPEKFRAAADAAGQAWKQLEFGDCVPPVLLRFPVHVRHAGRWWFLSRLRTPGTIRIMVDRNFMGTFGSDLPFRSQPTGIHNLSLPLDLSAGDHEIFIWAQEKHGPCSMNFAMIPDALFPDYIEDSVLKESLNVGYMAAILAVAFFLWLSMRESAFGWYFFYFSFAFLWFFTKRGLAFKYLWPNWPELNHFASIIFSYLAIIGIIMFVRDLLKLKKISRTAWWILNGAVLGEVLWIPLLLVFPDVTGIPWIRNLAKVVTMLALTLGIGILGWAAVIKKISMAFKLLIAFSPLFLTCLFGMVIEFGLISDGRALKADLLTVALMVENSLTTLILVREVHMRERRRLKLEKSFNRRVVEKLDGCMNMISQELHDDLGQQLSSLRLQFYTCHQQLSREMYNRLDHSMEIAIRSVRSLSHRLHPRILESDNVRAALHELADEYSRIGQKMMISSQGMIPKFPIAESTHIFRIVQEATHNAVRHAGASLITVEFERAGNFLNVKVSDNGCGFNYDEVKKGMGLTGIRARTEALGGILEILSSPESGTLLKISIPLKERIS